MEYNVLLSVRGGGHSYSCESTVHGGIMIDTRKLRKFEVFQNATDPFVELGAGNTWGQVLPKLEAHKFVAVHGQCTSVGVTGFATHGNYLSIHSSTPLNIIVYIYCKIIFIKIIIKITTII